MKLLKLGETEKFKFEICIVSLTILFYLFRTSIPIFKYPFLLLYVSLLVYSAVIYKKRIIPTLVEFFHNYYLLFILGLILAISFLLSNKLYLTIFKDVVNLFILLSIFLISTLVISGKKELSFFVSNLAYFVVLFAFVVSISGLLDLLNIVSYIDFSQINAVDNSVLENSIPIDYNFALLPVFFGIISIFYFIRKPNSKLQLFCYNFLLVIFSFTIILSGSRRGLIVFAAIMFFLLAVQIPALNRKNQFLKKIGSDSKYFLLTFFLLATIFSYEVFYADYSFKIKVLELSGSKNLRDSKQKIAVKMYKYTSIFGPHCTLQEFYSRIWPTIPEDPDSGWGTRVHKTIFPLAGKNIGIVPKGVKGYLLDKTCVPSYYLEENLYESYTLVVGLNVNKGEKIKASVYCFVSEDFDGNTVSLGCSNLTVAKGIVTGKPYVFYDLKCKGIWQKLEIEFNCNDGYAPIGLSFTKNGETDFSKLNGYVVFAYPQYSKIDKTVTDLSSDAKRTKIVKSGSGDSYLSHNEMTKRSFRSLMHSELIDTDTYSIKGSYALGTVNTTQTVPYLSYYHGFEEAGFCYCVQSFLFPLAEIKNDNDPIRKLVSKFISEDTTYYPYKSNIVLDTISNAFIGDRVSRWEFALKIFSKEYNWKQRIFGGGFNFLNWYGYYFDKDKTRSDYPHNPFLSVLLYSGIFGLIIYLIFMYKVFYYYIKYFKEYKILAIFFIITFFFSFFSAGNPFDPPIMGFFVILPFFIHSIHKREKNNTKELESEE